MSSSGSSSGDGAGEAGSAHGVGGGECLVCFEDITPELYCEYRRKGDPQWHACRFCYPCVQTLQQTQFHRYCESVAKSTCAREQQALLRKGPPINLSDAHAFPICGAEEVEALWVAAQDKEVSSKLDGSLTGEARQKLWDDLRAFLIENEPLEESKEGVAS